MVRVQKRKRLLRKLGNQADIYDRISQSAYEDIISKVCKVVTNSLKYNKKILLSELRKEYGNQGVATTKSYMKDWVTSVVNSIFTDGYDPILEAAINSAIDPTELNEEETSMNKAQQLLAVAGEVYRKGERLLGRKIFAEAMKQDDADRAIAYLSSNVQSRSRLSSNVRSRSHICGSCGTKHLEKDTYCTQCGASLAIAGKRIRKPINTKATVISASAKKKLIAIANDIASRDGGAYRNIAKNLVTYIRCHSPK